LLSVRALPCLTDSVANAGENDAAQIWAASSVLNGRMTPANQDKEAREVGGPEQGG
jgi:hypothetical protein